MAEEANALSRNPNVCAACFSLADGIGPEEESIGNDQETPNRLSSGTSLSESSFEKNPHELK